MPRPKTKEDLIKLSKTNYKKLMDYIDSLSEEQRTSSFSSETMNRNIRDVLTHLHHWNLMFIEWHNVGMKGGKPDMPAKGYTWKTVPELNKWIWEKYQTVSLEEARKLLENSFTTIQQIIDKYTDEELFEKKRYKWTGSTSMGSYLVSVSSSHLDWALKLIKKGLK